MLRSVLALATDPSFDVVHASHFDFAASLASRAPSAESRSLRMKLLTSSLNDGLLQRDWRELSRRLRPLLDAIALTAEERRTLGAGLTKAMSYVLPYNLKNQQSIRDLVTAGHLDDSDVLSRIAGVERNAVLMARAQHTGDLADIRAVFAHQTDLAGLQGTFNHLGGHLPHRSLVTGLDEALKHDPTIYTRMLRTSPDMAVATRMLDGLESTFDHLYAAALAADDHLRNAFLRNCLQTDACRPLLEIAVKHDGGRIFRNPPDARALANELRAALFQDTRLARELTLVALAQLKRPSDLVAFAETFHREATPKLLDVIVAHARRIGLNNFDPPALRDLADHVNKSEDLRQELLEHAARRGHALSTTQCLIGLGHTLDQR